MERGRGEEGEGWREGGVRDELSEPQADRGQAPARPRLTPATGRGVERGRGGRVGGRTCGGVERGRGEDGEG